MMTAYSPTAHSHDEDMRIYRCGDVTVYVISSTSDATSTASTAYRVELRQAIANFVVAAPEPVEQRTKRPSQPVPRRCDDPRPRPAPPAPWAHRWRTRALARRP